MLGLYGTNNCPKGKEGRRGKRGGEVGGAMNNPNDCYLLLLHIWWNTWVQGDLRKLYVTGWRIKVISMKPNSPQDTDWYMKGRGCWNFGTL